MLYYVLIKVKIDILRLAKVINNMVVRQHGFLESIVTDQSLISYPHYDLYCTNSYGLNGSYLQPFTPEQMARQRNKTA